MKKTSFKIFIFLINLAAFAMSIAVFGNSYLVEGKSLFTSDIASFLLLGGIAFLFSFFYVFFLSEDIGQEPPFLWLFILAFQIALLAKLDSTILIKRFLPVNPVLIPKVLIFCAVTMNLTLTGYGIFSQNKAREPIILYTFGSWITAASIAKFVPVTQGFFDLNSNRMLMIIFCLLCLINIVIFMVLLISNPIGTHTIRTLTGLLFSILTWMFFSFSMKIAYIICADYMVASIVIITVIAKYNSIKL